MANSVVRYLVEQHNIPVYRIYVLGMGNAKVQTAAAESSSNTATTKSSRPAPNRVEVSLLKNNLEQLASSGNTAQQPNANATMNGQVQQ
jgi:hypothetical protein